MRTEKINAGWRFWKDGSDIKTTVDLPHDAMLLEERDPLLEKGASSGFYPGGKYLYEKTIFGREEYAGQSVIVEFDGVYMNPSVYLNGEKVGSWVYGYTDFRVDLTGRLVIGAENTLLVETDNSRTPNSRWYSGSGIYRDVFLHTGNPAHIVPDGIRVRTVSIDPAVIEVDVETVGEGDVRVSVLDGSSVVASGSGRHLTLEIPNAKLWTAEQPHLYTVRAELVQSAAVVDAAQCRTGVRTIAWNAQNGLQINGNTVKLKGGCVHHDHGPLGARAYEKAERRRIIKLRDMGFNCIRYAHNPASRQLLDLCDEIGMYIMDETFDQWRQPQSTYDYATVFDSEWKKDISALVHKAYSHPSVIMYCLGNEITDLGLPYAAAICKEMSEYIKSLDDTRPTTLAVNGMLAGMAAKVAELQAQGSGAKQVGSEDVNQLIATILPKIRAEMTAEKVDRLVGSSLACIDIPGYNYADGDYDYLHEKYPERVICSTETFPNGVGERWARVEQESWLIGDFMWTCWDYLGETGVGQPVYGAEQAPFSKPYPCQSADCGAFDLTGMPETTAYYTAIVWGVYKQPYIGVRPLDHSGEKYTLGRWRMTDTQHSWTWPGGEGKTAQIEVYSPGESVRLLLNGECVGEAKTEFWKCRFEIPYVCGILEAVAYDAQGVQIGRDTLRTAGEKTRLTIVPEETVICADGADLAYIAVYVTDENGTVKMLSDKKVSIAVEGAGVLEAVGSAEPNTTERFDSGSYTTCFGRMIAIVRSTGKQGKIRITASAEGLEPVSTTIEAR